MAPERRRPGRTAAVSEGGGVSASVGGSGGGERWRSCQREHEVLRYSTRGPELNASAHGKPEFLSSFFCEANAGFDLPVAGDQHAVRIEPHFGEADVELGARPRDARANAELQHRRRNE